MLISDPLASEPAEYLQLRSTLRGREELRIREVLAAVREERSLSVLGRIESAVDRLRELRDLKADFSFSTTIRSWTDALERGLRWLQRGVARDFLAFFDEPTAFERDLAAEYPRHFSESKPKRSATIQGSVDVVAVDEWLQSPRLGPHVLETFPNYPSAELYAAMDPHVFERSVRHLDDALALLAAREPEHYQDFLRNVHSIAVAVLHGPTSFGTRPDQPGRMNVGLSVKTLERNDLQFTASLLYHEHCHVKLALVLEVLEPNLPQEPLYVSTFKNELREIETLLHQLYPVSAECAMRSSFAEHGSEEDRKRARRHFVPTIARLEPTAELFAIFPPLQQHTVVDQISRFGRKVTQTITEEIERNEPALLDELAHERVLVRERHAWDIGQFLCRGLEVRDPNLSDVRELGKEKVRFKYQGVEHRAKKEPARGPENRYTEYLADAR